MLRINAASNVIRATDSPTLLELVFLEASAPAAKYNAAEISKISVVLISSILTLGAELSTY